ncbi:MAG: hypothetical protein ACKVT0_11980 [Planctomycetaceae bacterium]
MPRFVVPYPRPRSLSDPFFDYSPEHLSGLLATPDDKLQLNDFQSLLGTLPAGTYEESAYFLPLAFDYLFDHDDDALHLITSLVWFASEYATNLCQDGVLDFVRSELKQILNVWTDKFTVIHFDADACREKGWGLQYDDYVEHSGAVIETTNDLDRCKVHDDLAISFYRDLAATEGDASKSAWFLECVRAHLEQKFSRPPKRPEIRQLLENTELVMQHATFVRQMLPGFNNEPTYWRDVFSLLGIHT